MKNIKFLIVLTAIIGWQSIMAQQKIGIGVEEPQTTLQVKNKLVVRDIRKFDSSKKLWGLYIANRDFTTNKGVKVKKGQIIKSRLEGSRKIYTFELFLKCGSNSSEWLTDIDYYALGISPEDYVVFITESGLYSLDTNTPVTKEELKSNAAAMIAHLPENGVVVQRNQINPVKNVHLFRAYVSSTDPKKRNPQYLLSASFSNNVQINNNKSAPVYKKEKQYSPKGFYWRFKFIVIDKSLAERIKATDAPDRFGRKFHTYTMESNMKKTANLTVNNELDSKREKINDLRPPISAIELFKDYQQSNLKTSINSNEQPTATLDVYGNLSISDIKNQRESLHRLANLFVDEDGYLYSFVPSEIEQKEMALVEGYINTRGRDGNFKNANYSLSRVSAPGTGNFGMQLGDEAFVGDFDLRIPYNEYIVIPVSSNFGNYDQKRRWLQQLRDKYGEFGATKYGRSVAFKMNNWYSNFGLYGYDGSTRADDGIKIKVVDDAYGNTTNSPWWSYMFGLGHYAPQDFNPYNTQKVQKVFRAEAKDGSYTWHISLDYPKSRAIYGLAATVNNGTNVYFQPQTFQDNQDKFYWKYSVLAFSRSIIQDLGRMYDSMDYYRDYYATYNGPNANASGGVKQKPAQRSITPAVYQVVFQGKLIPFLIQKNAGLLQQNEIPIVPSNGEHPNGYIEDFKINLPVDGGVYQSNKPEGEVEEGRRFDSTNKELYYP